MMKKINVDLASQPEVITVGEKEKLELAWEGLTLPVPGYSQQLPSVNSGHSVPEHADYVLEYADYVPEHADYYKLCARAC